MNNMEYSKDMQHYKEFDKLYRLIDLMDLLWLGVCVCVCVVCVVCVVCWSGVDCNWKWVFSYVILQLLEHGV